MTFYVDPAGNTSRHLDSVGQNAGQHGAGSHEPLPCVWEAIDARLRRDRMLDRLNGCIDNAMRAHSDDELRRAAVELGRIDLL